MSKNRKLIRFLKRRKILRFATDVDQFRKFSLICFVGNSSNNRPSDETLMHLFNAAAVQAVELFKLVAKLGAKSLLQFIAQNKWFSAFGFFASIALMILKHKVDETSGRVKIIIQRIANILLVILTVFLLYLLGVILRNGTLSNISKWLKSILIALLNQLINTTTSLQKYYEPKLRTELSLAENKNDNFKSFLFFSLLTLLTFNRLFNNFKEEIVNDVPLGLGSAVIEYIEVSENPNLLNRLNYLDYLD